MGYGDRLTAGSVSSNDLMSRQNEFEETDWTDSNSDGLADGWVCDQGTPIIVNTVDQLAVTAQKINAELLGAHEGYLKKLVDISGALMRLTFTYESNEPIEVYATGTSDKKIGEVAANLNYPFGEGDITFEAEGKDGIKFRLKQPDGTDKYMTFIDVKLEVLKTDNVSASSAAGSDQLTQSNEINKIVDWSVADTNNVDQLTMAENSGQDKITAADGNAQDNLSKTEESLPDQLSTKNVQTDGYKSESVSVSGMTMSAQQDYSIDTLVGVDKNNKYNFNYTDLQLDMNTDADTYDFNTIGR